MALAPPPLYRRVTSALAVAARGAIIDDTPYWCIFARGGKAQAQYDLDAFKTAFATVERLRVTGVAVRTAAALGFNRVEIVATMQTMRRSQFYKSMTAYADHRVWQDFYHVPSPAGTLCVKFTADAVSEFLLLSFKERCDD